MSGKVSVANGSKCKDTLDTQQNSILPWGVMAVVITSRGVGHITFHSKDISWTRGRDLGCGHQCKANMIWQEIIFWTNQTNTEDKEEDEPAACLQQRGELDTIHWRCQILEGCCCLPLRQSWQQFVQCCQVSLGYTAAAVGTDLIRSKRKQGNSDLQGRERQDRERGTRWIYFMEGPNVLHSSFKPLICELYMVSGNAPCTETVLLCNL